LGAKGIPGKGLGRFSWPKRTLGDGSGLVAFPVRQFTQVHICPLLPAYSRIGLTERQRIHGCLDPRLDIRQLTLIQASTL